MQNNQNKWSFFRLPSKTPLSQQEVMYWKNNLKKILKVGLEFEFNLPNKKNGSCTGNSSTCPCIHLSMENDCWKRCINAEACSLHGRNLEGCLNVTGTCEPEDCATCAHFKTACPGISCANFVSYCFECSDYERDCKSCKFAYDPTKSPKNIRQQLNHEFNPNNTYGLVSPTGVHSITTDGSLLGEKGAEVITVGRRVDYWEFYKMAKNINEQTVARGGYINERCSTHMHLLASYYGKVVPRNGDTSVPSRVSELEKDMPEIILANLHQLVRRYQNAMTWMMMGLDDPNRLTRWEKFRVSVLPTSAILNSMAEVKNIVADQAGGTKYGWINYNQVEFGLSGNVRRFHVEFRAADSLLSHSAIAAIACMYYALLIKAVEISRYGIVEVGDKEWSDHAQIVKDSLMNNMKAYGDGDRFSDTSHLREHYGLLASESLELVRQLKHILIKIGPAYEVLEKLAEKPCALRRCNGDGWEQIEQDLSVLMSEEGKIEVSIREIIDLRHISECKDIIEWVDGVSKVLGADPQTYGVAPDLEHSIHKFIETKQNDGELVWSNPIGAPVFI